MMMTYIDLLDLKTYEDRLEYLSLDAIPSEITFANLRHLNQKLYNSRRWRMVRDRVIIRDWGFDLAIPGRHIYGRTVVHHINPIKPKHVYLNDECLFDLNNLITVSLDTHLAIHYGSRPEQLKVVERFPGDTKLW